MSAGNKVGGILKQTNQTLKQQFKKNWWDQIWSHGNHWLPWHEIISYYIKWNFFVLWKTIYCSHQMATPKIILQIFICITIHQNHVLHEPWRRHSTSTSKMVGCHSIHIMKIPINKRELAGIRITQCSRAWSTIICSSIRHPSKFINIKINI